MQHTFFVETLPVSSLSAQAVFVSDHLAQVQSVLAGSDITDLAIVLAAAPADHDDWRRALALDLARAHAPVRVNVIGASSGDAADAVLLYLRDAQGVTGQYLQSHE